MNEGGTTFRQDLVVKKIQDIQSSKQMEDLWTKLGKPEGEEACTRKFSDGQKANRLDRVMLSQQLVSEALYTDIFLDKQYSISDHWPVVFTIKVPSILHLTKLKELGRENLSTKYWKISQEVAELKSGRKIFFIRNWRIFRQIGTNGQWLRCILSKK